MTQHVRETMANLSARVMVHILLLNAQTSWTVIKQTSAHESDGDNILDKDVGADGDPSCAGTGRVPGTLRSGARPRNGMILWRRSELMSHTL